MKFSNICYIFGFVLLFFFSDAEAVKGNELPPIPGVVLLDEISFNKTLKKFPFAFVIVRDGSTVKSAADKAAEFGRLSSLFLTQNSDILAAEVRLRWGEPEAKKLASRFQITDNLVLPELILFSVDKIKSAKGWSLHANETRYGGEVSVKQLVYFLKGITCLSYNDSFFIEKYLLKIFYHINSAK